MLSEQEKIRISSLSQELHGTIRKVSILKYLRWDAQVKHDFLSKGGRELPIVSYAAFNGKDMLAKLDILSNKVQNTLFDQWIERHIHVARTTINMLMAVGTSDFNEFSVELYGQPEQLLHDNETTSLALAEKFHQLLSGRYVPQSEPEMFPASYAQQEIARRTQRIFGDKSPSIILSDDLTSNAAASSKRIRLRASAKFTERDIEQLIQHEASIHVAKNYCQL